MLQQIPPELVTAEALRFLSANRDIEAHVRRFCYAELDKRQAGKIEAGYQLFAQGVDDPAVRAVSILGLADAPPDRRPDAIGLLLSNLDWTDVRSSLDGVVNRLSKWGPDAQLGLPVIAHIFHDEQQDERTRSIAAQAILTIGPVGEALKQFGPNDRSAVLGPLALIGGKTNGKFDGQLLTKEKARAYVREALQADDKQVRESALVALPNVYGEDFIIGDPADGYRANPDFLGAVQLVATSDADPELRERANHWLQTMDERVQKAVRKRENRAGSTGQ